MTEHTIVDPLLTEFLNEKSLSCTEKTLKNYKTFIGQYSRHIEKPLAEGRREDITGFLMSLQQRGYAKSSLCTIQTCIIGFYDWCRDNEKIQNSPCKGLSRIKADKKAPVYLTMEEVRRLIEVAEDPRDNLIVKILYITGVRVSELVSIRRRDIDFENGDIKVMGKGAKERIVNISSPRVREQARQYCQGFDDDQQLFPLHTVTIERDIKALAKAAGIKKHVTPHKLRHSFATHLYLAGGKLVGIQKLLGHESLSTTQIYTHYSLEEQREMLAHSPMANV